MKKQETRGERIASAKKSIGDGVVKKQEPSEGFVRNGEGFYKIMATPVLTGIVTTPQDKIEHIRDVASNSIQGSKIIITDSRGKQKFVEYIPPNDMAISDNILKLNIETKKLLVLIHRSFAQSSNYSSRFIITTRDFVNETGEDYDKLTKKERETRKDRLRQALETLQNLKVDGGFYECKKGHKIYDSFYVLERVQEAYGGFVATISQTYINHLFNYKTFLSLPEKALSLPERLFTLFFYITNHYGQGGNSRNVFLLDSMKRLYNSEDTYRNKHRAIEYWQESLGDDLDSLEEMGFIHFDKGGLESEKMYISIKGYPEFECKRKNKKRGNGKQGELKKAV